MSNDYDKPTPHDTLKDFIPPSREEIEEMKQKRVEKLQRLVAGDPELPPESPTGKCVACIGVVSMKYVKKESRPVWEAPTYGGRAQYSWHAKGLHCDTCGLKYEFIPFSREKSSPSSE